MERPKGHDWMPAGAIIRWVKSRVKAPGMPGKPAQRGGYGEPMEHGTTPSGICHHCGSNLWQGWYPENFFKDIFVLLLYLALALGLGYVFFIALFRGILFPGG